MRIISHKHLTRSTAEERREATIESIRELEEQYERDEMEQHAYFIKKKALIKLL